MYKDILETTNRYFELMDSIEENNGELTEELEKEFDQLFNDLAQLTDGFATTIKQLEGLKELEKKKKEKHESKAKNIENQIKALKAKAISMIQNDIELNSDSFKLSVNTRVTPQVYYTDYNEVPEEYVEYTPKVNMKKWIKDIKNNRVPKPEGYFEKETTFLTIR